MVARPTSTENACRKPYKRPAVALSADARRAADAPHALPVRRAVPAPRKQRFDAKQEGRDLYGKHTVFSPKSSCARIHGSTEGCNWSLTL